LLMISDGIGGLPGRGHQVAPFTNPSRKSPCVAISSRGRTILNHAKVIEGQPWISSQYTSVYLLLYFGCVPQPFAACAHAPATLVGIA
jgi:hypothetical protein